jgi:hypothetical protein
VSVPEKTLADLREDILRAGGWVTGGIVIATILAVAFIIMATPFYRAQMIVAPANPANSSTSIESFPGTDDFIRRGSVGESGDFLRFENMVAGPSVAAKLLQDDKIKRGLSFDKTFENSREQTEWSPEQLAEYIAKRVRVEPVGATALRRLVYQHPSREFGVYFLHSIHRITDEMIRAQARQEAEARVKYLQQAGFEANNPDHRRALTALLLEQERLLMLASIDQAYAASVIEPPASSWKPRWPDPFIIVPSMIFAGALLGFFLHGFFSPSRDKQYALTLRRKVWYKPESDNSNERPLERRKAAE